MIYIFSLAILIFCVNAQFHSKHLQFNKYGHPSNRHDFVSFTHNGYKGYSQNFQAVPIPESLNHHSRTWNYAKNTPNGIQVGQKSVNVKPIDRENYHGFETSYSDRSVHYTHDDFKPNAFRVQFSTNNIPIVSSHMNNVDPTPIADAQTVVSPVKKSSSTQPSSSKQSDFNTDVDVQTNEQDMLRLPETTPVNEETEATNTREANSPETIASTPKDIAPESSVPELSEHQIETDDMFTPESNTFENHTPTANVPQTTDALEASTSETTVPEVSAPEPSTPMNMPTINAPETTAFESSASDKSTPAAQTNDVQLHQQEVSGKREGISSPPPLSPQTSTQTSTQAPTSTNRNKSSQGNAETQQVTIVRRVKTVVFGHDFNQRQNLIVFAAVVSMMTVAIYSLILMCCTCSKSSKNTNSHVIDQSIDSTHIV